MPAAQVPPHATQPLALRAADRVLGEAANLGGHAVVLARGREQPRQGGVEGARADAASDSPQVSDGRPSSSVASDPPSSGGSEAETPNPSSSATSPTTEATIERSVSSIRVT
ncbi:hypothetical protein GCM10025875_19570 [Litorihabitans aurantiacus]|uniref:Uncharacterized protein n=1 Tax=Litorihabitans aurantiacus TaxID=1930061 RepID=A0AA37XF64_9MICO|nr:hypothetical protein GCM10025875_19570 [Litorihabitans aurantiacus]